MHIPFSMLIFCTLIFNVLFGQSAIQSDSLILQLKTSINDSNKVNILIQLANENRRENPKKSLEYSSEALIISEEINFLNGEALSYYYLGSAKSFSQEYQKSISLYLKALSRFELLNDKEKIADCFKKIGTLYIYLGENSKTIEYLLKSIPIYIEINDSLQLANCYSNIAISYFNSGKNEDASEYLHKAATLFKLLGNDQDQFGAYIGLGNISDSKNEFKKSEEYYLQSLAIAERLGIDELMSTSLGSLGLSYNSLGDYKKAISNFRKAIEIEKKLEDFINLSISYTNLSSAFLNLNEWNKAIDALDSAKKYSDSETYLFAYESIFENYALAYEKKGDFNKALQAYKEYSSIRDSIYSKENSDKINELTIQFETNRKEKELIHLVSENKTQELELAKKTNQRNIIISISALLLLILLFSIIYWKQKQTNSEKEIVLNRERINSLIKENEINYANAMIEGQEVERKRLAQDLHDRVGSMLSTVKLHFSSGKPQSHDKAQKLLDESVEEVRKISHNLASSSLIKFGLTASLQSLTESISSDNLNVSFLHYGIESRLSPNTEITIYRCVQELISNIIKHANASKITIQIQKNDNELNLIVEDNGVGFDTSKEFTGIGIKNVKSRINSINGKIDFDSTIDRGTSIIIDIPLET